MVDCAKLLWSKTPRMFDSYYSKLEGTIDLISQCTDCDKDTLVDYFICTLLHSQEYIINLTTYLVKPYLFLRNYQITQLFGDPEMLFESPSYMVDYFIAGVISEDLLSKCYRMDDFIMYNSDIRRFANSFSRDKKTLKLSDENKCILNLSENILTINYITDKSRDTKCYFDVVELGRYKTITHIRVSYRPTKTELIADVLVSQRLLWNIGRVIILKAEFNRTSIKEPVNHFLRNITVLLTQYKCIHAIFATTRNISYIMDHTNLPKTMINDNFVIYSYQLTEFDLRKIDIPFWAITANEEESKYDARIDWEYLEKCYYYCSGDTKVLPSLANSKLANNKDLVENKTFLSPLILPVYFNERAYLQFIQTGLFTCMEKIMLLDINHVGLQKNEHKRLKFLLLEINKISYYLFNYSFFKKDVMKLLRRNLNESDLIIDELMRNDFFGVAILAYRDNKLVGMVVATYVDMNTTSFGKIVLLLIKKKYQAEESIPRILVTKISAYFANIHVQKILIDINKFDENVVLYLKYFPLFLLHVTGKSMMTNTIFMFSINKQELSKEIEKYENIEKAVVYGNVTNHQVSSYIRECSVILSREIKYLAIFSQEQFMDFLLYKKINYYVTNFAIVCLSTCLLNNITEEFSKVLQQTYSSYYFKLATTLIDVHEIHRKKNARRIKLKDVLLCNSKGVFTIMGYKCDKLVQATTVFIGSTGIKTFGRILDHDYDDETGHKLMIELVYRIFYESRTETVEKMNYLEINKYNELSVKASLFSETDPWAQSKLSAKYIENYLKYNYSIMTPTKLDVKEALRKFKPQEDENGICHITTRQTVSFVNFSPKYHRQQVNQILATFNDTTDSLSLSENDGIFTILALRNNEVIGLLIGLIANHRRLNSAQHIFMARKQSCRNLNVESTMLNIGREIVLYYECRSIGHIIYECLSKS